MSKTIDEKVVSMQFDNANFEKNVKTSMSTLDKLKNSLKFDGAAKGFSEISAAAGKCDMSSLSSGVEQVKMRFSALEVIAVTALANITNSAVNAGKQLISSLTVDQIAAGWTKYGQKTASVQTIMNATGKSIVDVNGYLDELMWFSDETSYGFTDMTAALAQMTSAGGDIDKLIPLITGVANATAFAGKGAKEFSHVMYNLNQSYSKGFLDYTDWKSIDLMGASSKQLKKTLIDTAVEMGRVKEGTVDLANFASTLKDKWADTEVMEAAFGKFASLSQEAYKLVQAGEFDTASEAIEHLSGQYDDLAVSAFKSAQEAKTFSEAIEATQDAVSSGWMNTFELLFGNYDEAKVLWTDLANNLWDIFASGGETRNEILSDALSSKWDKLVSRIEDAGMSAEDFDGKLSGILKENGHDVDALVEEYGSLGEAFHAGAISSEFLTEALSSVSTSIADLSLIKEDLDFGDTGDAVSEAQKALRDLGYDLGEFGEAADGVDGKFGDLTKSAVEAFQAANNLKITGIIDSETLAAMETAVSTSNNLALNCKDLISSITELGGREHIFAAIGNSFEGLKTAIGAVRDAWNKTFYGDASYEDIVTKRAEKILNLTEAIHNFSEKLNINEDTASKLSRTFQGLFAILDIIKTVVGGVLGAAFKAVAEVLAEMDIGILDVTASIGDFLVGVRDWINQHNFVVKAFKAVIKICVKAVKAIENWIDSFMELPGVQTFITDFESAIETAFTNIDNWLTNSEENFGEIFKQIGEWLTIGAELVWDFLKSLNGLEDINFENIKSIFKSFGSSIVKLFDGSKFSENMSTVLSKLKEFRDFVVSKFSKIGDTFEALRGNLATFAKTAKEKLENAWASFSKFVSDISWDDLIMGAKMAGIMLFMYQMYRLISNLAALPKALTGLVTDVDKGVKALVKKLQGSAIDSFAATCKQFAIAVGIIAASIVVLSLLDWKEAWKAAVAVGAIMVILTGIAAILAKVSGKFGEIKLVGLGAALTGLGIGVLLLSSALKKLEGVKWKDSVDGLKILGTMLAGLTIAGMGLGIVKGAMVKSAIALLLFVGALRLMISVLKSYEKLKWEDIKNGVPILQDVFAALTGFVVIAGLATRGSSLFGAAASILALMASLMYMKVVLKSYAKEDWSGITDGIGPLAAAFAAILAFIYVVGKSNQGTFGSGFGAAAVILAVGFAMGLLADATKKFGEMPTNEWVRGLGSVAVLIVGLYAMILALGKLNGDKVGKAILALALGLGVIAVAISIFGTLPIGELVQGGISVGVLLLALGGALALAGKFQSKSAIVGILVMTAALAAMTFMVYELSKIPWQELIGPALTLGLLLMAVGGSLALASKFTSWSAVVGILAMTLALAAAVGGLYILQDIPIEQMTVSALALGALLMILAASLQIANSFGSASASIGILAMSIGIVALATALYMLQDVRWESLLASVLAFTVIIGVLVGASFLIQSLAVGVVLLNATFLILAVSTLIIAGAFYIFANSLTIVGYALPLIAAGFASLGEGIASFIASIANCEGAMANFDSVMSTLGEAILIFLGKIATGFLEVTAGILSFGVACIILGASLVVASAGIVVLAAAFVVLSGSIIIGAAAILILGAAIAGAINLVLGALGIMTGSMESAGGDVASGFANGIAGGTGGVIEAVAGFVGGVIDTIKSLLGINSPSTVAHELGENTVQGYANGIDDASGSAEESTSNFIQNIIDSLKGGEEGFGTEGLEGGNEFLTNFSDGIDLNNLDLSNLNTDQLTEVFGSLGGEAGTTFGTDFTNGIDLSTLDLSSLGGTDLTALFGDKGTECGTALTTGITEGAGEVSIEPALTTMLSQCSNSKPQFVAAGKELAQAIASGFTQGQAGILSNVTNNVASMLVSINTQQPQFQTAGRNLMDSLQSGIRGKAGDLELAASIIALSCATVVGGYYKNFVAAGEALGQGFADGIELKAAVAAAAAKAMAEAALAAAKAALLINSPSKVFREVGKSVPEGFAQGIGMLGSSVKGSVTNMAETAVAATQDALNHVGQVANSGLSLSPTISPVVDMSNASARNLKLTSSIDASLIKPVDSLSQIVTQAQSEINASNQEVVSAINGLRDDLNSIYSGDDQEIAFYVDSKKLASSLAKPMNRQLNILSKRGAY